MTPEEIQQRAAEMAAAVDARLSGVVLEDVVVATEAKQEEPEVSNRGLTEEEIFKLLADVGDSECTVQTLTYRWRMTWGELRRWIETFLEAHYECGWPNVLDKLEARRERPIGVDFGVARGTNCNIPRWLREWRCLWFLMRFYDDPKKCADEWRDFSLDTAIQQH